MGATPAISARGIVKRFPDVVANDGVDIDVRRGEVLAILGENGAGKTTLAAILAGLYHPDAGHLAVDGEPVVLHSPREALARGIGMVHQHFRLVERFTVAENIALGDPSQPVVLDTARLHREVADLGERFGLPVDPRARISDLSVGERQRVEIVKVLHRGADVLLLDEPTAVLAPQETDALFATLRAMRADGKAVVFISHKLGEVMDIADRVTVLRDGRVSGDVRTVDTDRHALARMMVGRDVDLTRHDGRRVPRAAPVVLRVRGLVVEDERRRVDGVDLDVHAGEIVGVAGVAGNGQRELADAVAGVGVPSAGRVEIDGVDVTGRGPRAARARGLRYVPEDRLGAALSPSLSIADNLALTRPTGFIVRRRRLAAEARQLIERFDIRAPGAEATAGALSGGNAQKVVLARELSGAVKVLIAASPTRGLDVGAVEYVRGRLEGVRAGGAGVLLLSEDLDEVVSLSDRIVVLYRGAIALETPGAGVDVEHLGRAMAGVV